MPADITSIDVGGDRYFLGTKLKHSGDLLMKKREEFTSTFGNYPIDLDRIEELFKKYLPSHGNTFEDTDFIFETDTDREDLLAVLERRLKQLIDQKRISNSVVNISNDRITNIQSLIQQIKKIHANAEKTFHENRVELATKKDKMRDQYKNIISFANALSVQLSTKSAPINNDWAAIVKNMDTLTIGQIIQKHKDLEEKKRQFMHNSRPVNYFTPQHDDSDSYNAHQTIRDRIETLTTVLELKEYLDKTSTSQKDLDTTSKTFDKKLSKSIMPLFDYFGIVFDPIYSFLEDNVKKQEVLIPSLLTLLSCCKSIYHTGNGIYRITNVDSDIYTFLCKQLQCMKDKLDTFGTEEQMNFIHHIETLPKVIHDTNDISSTISNPIRFFIVNENMTLPFKRKRSKALYDATTEFFKEGDIYLVLSDSMHCPMTTYEIDLLNSDTIMDHSFMKKGEFFLDEVVTLKESILYTDSELALSIFIGFKDLLPK